MKRFVAVLTIAGTTALVGGLGDSVMANGYPPTTTVAPTTTAAPTTTDVAGGGATTTAAPTDSLPATGSSTGSTTWIGGMLLLAGLGMFAVAQVRRRQTLTS